MFVALSARPHRVGATCRRYALIPKTQVYLSNATATATVVVVCDTTPGATVAQQKSNGIDLGESRCYFHLHIF